MARRARRNVTSRRITLSSKARLTLSNSTTGACGFGEFDGQAEVGKGLRVASEEQRNQQPRHEEVDDQHGHRRRDHSVGRGAAHALRAARASAGPHGTRW